MASRALWLLTHRGLDSIIVKQKGFYGETGLIEPHAFPISDFIPLKGILVPNEDKDTIRETLRRAIYGDGAVILSYSNAKWWYILSLSLYIVVNLFVLYSIYESYNVYYITVRGYQFIHDVIWYITNLFFFLQIWLFHKVSVKSVAVRYTITSTGSKGNVEAVANKEPLAIVLVPAYREDPQLIKRTLYGLILERYKNKTIVLLLDSDKRSKDKEERENAISVESTVDSINADLSSHENAMRRIKDSCKGDAGGELKESIELIRSWITTKKREIETSSFSYPIDDFLMKNVMEKQVEYFNEIDSRYQNEYNENSSAEEERHNPSIDYAEQEIERFFSTRIEVFKRSEYANTSKSRTKAANLSSFSNLINRKWNAREDELSGEKIIEIQGTANFKYKYVAIIDADVIVKPDYLRKKVAFMEDEANSLCGLVQSPYVVPENERSRIADAAGVHNDWFLPYSIGMNYFGSGFWLGYNGLFRYETIAEPDFFLSETAVEDMEISLKLRKKGFYVSTSSDEDAITFNPSDLGGLEIQRKRWASGCLKITNIFLRDISRRGYPGMKGSEIFFRLFYIINLNLLPLFSTILYFNVLSVSKDLVPLLMLPWLVYVLSLFNLERIKKRRRFSQVIDSILIYFFLNLFHLRGFLRSIRNLFVKEKVFLRTPKRNETIIGQKDKPALKYFEIFAILAITAYYIVMIILNVIEGQFYNYPFPVYYIVIIYAGLIRFVGIRNFTGCLVYRLFIAPIRFLLSWVTGKSNTHA